MKNKTVQPASTSTQLVEKVKSTDKTARRLNKIALTLIVLFGFAALTFISITSATSNKKLQKLIQSNHDITMSQNTQELAYVRNQSQGLANAQGLLEKQNEYLACIVNLFTDHAVVHSTDIAINCPDPFAPGTTSSSESATTPKVNQHSVQDTTPTSSAPIASAPGQSSGTSGSTPISPTPIQPTTPKNTGVVNQILNIITFPVRSLLGILNL